MMAGWIAMAFAFVLGGAFIFAMEWFVRFVAAGPPSPKSGYIVTPTGRTNACSLVYRNTGETVGSTTEHELRVESRDEGWVRMAQGPERIGGRAPICAWSIEWPHKYVNMDLEQDAEVNKACRDAVARIIAERKAAERQAVLDAAAKAAEGVPAPSVGALHVADTASAGAVSVVREGES